MQAQLPSVDALLRWPRILSLIETYGRPATTEIARKVLAKLRMQIGLNASFLIDNESITESIVEAIQIHMEPRLRRVFNLTGTVLHTNLGRAPLPQAALDAIIQTAGSASNLEFNLSSGCRGDRDAIVEERLCRLTGAEAATIVNNNAAAVMLLLNSLANRKEVPVSRGELVEIGGSFRIPDIMSRSGAKLVEVGTTNRTHLEDFIGAIGPRTSLLMKVHTSNYQVQGFTATVSEKELAKLAQDRSLPFAIDLGSGALTDMTKFGLPHEQTPAEALANGANIVTFSGDKLLGGPQAGLIVGRNDLIQRLKRNPLKRTIRCDKMTLAALDAVLLLYENPAKLATQIPSIRLLARGFKNIKEQADKIAPELQQCLGDRAVIEVLKCKSQIGSGALPIDALPSAGLAIFPAGKSKKARGGLLRRLATELRTLPIPIIGRIENDRLILDLRCLEDEDAFISQIRLLPKHDK